jgi:hypothetical protein
MGVDFHCGGHPEDVGLPVGALDCRVRPIRSRLATMADFEKYQGVMTFLGPGWNKTLVPETHLMGGTW